VRAGHALADLLERMQQGFLEAAAQAHALVIGQVLKECGQAPLQTHVDIHTLDLERGHGVGQAVSEAKLISVPVGSRRSSH
jgi:hypothetical protein